MNIEIDFSSKESKEIIRKISEKYRRGVDVVLTCKKSGKKEVVDHIDFSNKELQEIITKQIKKLFKPLMVEPNKEINNEN